MRENGNRLPADKVDKTDSRRENEESMESSLKPGQLVRVNLAGMQGESVTFHDAVTDAVGNIVKLISDDPPKYIVLLLFSFRGINEVEVPADRIRLVPAR